MANLSLLCSIGRHSTMAGGCARLVAPLFGAEAETCECWCHTRNDRADGSVGEGSSRQMTRRTVLRLVDDLDGSEAQETVTFGLDGRSYRLDLSEVNAARLRATFFPYLQRARRLSRNGQPYRRITINPEPAVIRAWGKSKASASPTEAVSPSAC